MEEYFVFEDRIGKLCLRFNLNIIRAVYPHWDYNLNADLLLDLVSKEIQNLSQQNKSFLKNTLFRDEETKRFLTYQTSDVLFQLKRLKKFLDDGISKGYKLVID